MRIKREKRGNKYYLVARDEKGRFITYVKWSSKKDKLEQLKYERKGNLERKLREREEETKFNIKRERWNNRYYLVARDEKGRIISRIKWSSKKDLMELYYQELKKRVVKKLGAERYIMVAQLGKITNESVSVSMGITTYVQDLKITKEHRAFTEDLHMVLVEFAENIGLTILGEGSRIQKVEDEQEAILRLAISEFEDLERETLKYWVEIDLDKWEITNFADTENLLDEWERVIERWRDRL